MMFSGCASGLTNTKSPPKVIEAKDACPPLPSRFREESKKRTGFEAEDLTKSQVLNLFRKYATSEIRKNYTIEQIANMYDRCRSEWFK
jgi:hypothetical protein